MYTLAPNLETGGILRFGSGLESSVGVLCGLVSRWAGGFVVDDAFYCIWWLQD